MGGAATTKARCEASGPSDAGSYDGYRWIVSNNVSIVLCLPESVTFFDPDPEQTRRRGVRLVSQWNDDVVGVVGWSDGGWAALTLAAKHSRLQRLGVMSTQFPDDETELGIDLSCIAAKTLLMFGSADPLTGHRHGSLWQKRLANARLEMVPGGDHDVLADKWERALSHLVPRRGGVMDPTNVRRLSDARWSRALAPHPPADRLWPAVGGFL
jgi:pimeloyl-ACP methyl ester carboxylesterase